MKGSPQTPVHNREHAPAEHHKQAHHKQEQRDQQPHQQPPQRRKHHRLLLALLLSAGLHLLLLWPQASSPGPQPPVINARLQLPEPVIPQLTARPASQPLPQPAEQLPSTKPAATQDSTRGVSAAANQHKSAGAQPGSGTAAEETTTPASDNRAESADRQPSPGKTEAMEQALAADPQERHYQQQILAHLREQLIAPAQFRGELQLQLTLRYRRIATDVQVVISSGNAQLDAWAVKAAIAANPYPAVPDSLPSPYRFRPILRISE